MKNINFAFLISYMLTTIFSIKKTNKIESLFLTSEIKQPSNITESETDYILQIFSAKGICNSDNCHNPYGQCSDNITCQCNPGYAQFENESSTNTSMSCSYKLYNQSVAFILEFFIPLGAGHIYCERILYGVLKMAGLTFIVLFDCFRNWIFETEGEKNNPKSLLIMLVLVFCFIIWELIDLCLFGLNIFKDGNDMPLSEWGYIVTN